MDHGLLRNYVEKDCQIGKNRKKIELINTQKNLSNLLSNIKNNEDNNGLIKQILNHTRLDHTLACIKKEYQNIIKFIPFTVFRDFNGTIKNDIDKQFNDYSLEEHDILLNLSKKYNMFWLVNGGHDLWFNEFYKK